MKFVLHGLPLETPVDYIKKELHEMLFDVESVYRLMEPQNKEAMHLFLEVFQSKPQNVKYII